jgi:hypothetical protein
VLALGSGALVGASVEADAVPTARHIRYHDWSSTRQLDRGTHEGTRAVAGELRFSRPAGTRGYAGRRYEYAAWVSPSVPARFGATELIASWSARTPARSWVQVEARATTATGELTTWYVMGRWAAGDRWFERTSAGRQADEHAEVAVDTLRVVSGHRFVRWQLRALLMRPAGGTAVPRLQRVGAVVSRLPSGRLATPSAAGPARGVELAVPPYSQQRHRGHFPQWGGGGEAWCSPTSTAMVLSYWRSGPSAADSAWVRDRVDPMVDHAARATYDYAYGGTGNWPFNTAYAAQFGMSSFVTRLRSLNEAERFVAAGIPVVASLSFTRSELDGAGYGSNGHLMVIIGFRPNGNVIVNDPASHLRASNSQVRVVYDRLQFENAWLRHSGGLSYVIHPPSVALPAAPGQANW